MSHKKKIYLILIVSVVAFIASLALALPENFGLCLKSDEICIDGYIHNYNMLATLLIMFSVPIFIFSATCLFLKEQIFNSWSKFSVIFIPIAIGAIVWMKVGTRGTLISIDEKNSTPVLASIFVIISLLIIIFKSLQLRKGQE